MDRLELMTEKVGMLMGGECLVKKQRSLVITARNARVPYSLDLDISFTKFKENGSARNKTINYLLPEEL